MEDKKNQQSSKVESQGEPFRERGVHVNKPSTNQFLISEPKHWLNYATKEVLKIVQAYFNFL